MKNIINITREGEQLVSSTDDGTNTLYINDNEIPSSSWIGSGNYTTTVNGHNITIKKCTDLNGNCQLVKISDYNYQMRKTALAGQLQMLNYIYPVGSCYETSDASFDPNVVWGGTWTSEQIKDDAIIDTTIYAGTNGIIWGEKWAIRVYIYSLTKTHYSTYNNMYGYNQIIDWATDTGWNFKDTNYSVSYDWRIGSGFAITAGEMQRYTGKCTVYALASTSGSQPVNISLKADGFWKDYTQPTTKYRWHRTV